MRLIAIPLVALGLAFAAPAAAQDKVDPATARSPNAEQELLTLSKTKWRWMSERLDREGGSPLLPESMRA
jgi:hypothetical protein